MNILEKIKFYNNKNLVDQDFATLIKKQVEKEARKANITNVIPIIKERRKEKNIQQKFGISKEEYYQIMKQNTEKIIYYLKMFKKFKLVNLINKLIDNMEIDDVYLFFNTTHQLIDLEFNNITFSKEDLEILSNWYIIGPHKYKNCIFEIDYKTAHEELYSFFYQTDKFINCSFNNNSYQNDKYKKIQNSPFSCNTSVYIKLGNKCNGNCSFCKNHTEEIIPPNTNKIIQTLTDKNLAPHLNQIYFGGGEPTLYLDEIEQLITEYKKISPERLSTNFYIFTNGSYDWERLSKEFLQKFNNIRNRPIIKIILSRQEIEDKKNNQIIGIDYSIDDPFLKELIFQNKIIFALTYSSLNARKNFLKEYIRFGKEYGIKNFIIQNLETKTENFSNETNKDFISFENYLRICNYIETKIASTSYFDLNLFKNNNESISVKKYFEPEKLQEHFDYCPKHSFDLGISPDGTLYNDFQMIKKLTKTR